MTALSPSARRPGCPALVPIGGDGTYGFCPVHGRHVYLDATDRCLCDHCIPGPGDHRTIDPDVTFQGNDIVALKSEHEAWLARERARAEAMHCAPRRPEDPAPEAKPATKPAPRRKPGLLAFT